MRQSNSEILHKSIIQSYIDSFKGKKKTMDHEKNTKHNPFLNLRRIKF